MMRRPIALLVVLMMVFGPLVQGVDIQEEKSIEQVDPDVVEPPASIRQSDARELLSNIDGFFTENLGQKGEGAGRFYCEGSPLSVAFGDGWVAYDYRLRSEGTGQTFRVSFGDDRSTVPSGRGLTVTRTNFILSNDPGSWIIGARSYRSIEYLNVYDNIDLRFYFTEGSLKYEYTIWPRADPNLIVQRYEGIEGLGLDTDTGDLIINTTIGNIRDEAPLAYYRDSIEMDRIQVEYSLTLDSGVGFTIGDFNRRRPLIVDPGIDFSTYIGGIENDFGRAIHIDDNQDVLVAGMTVSTDFPTTLGAYNMTFNGVVDGYLCKLTDNGTVLAFSTFIGGADGEEIYDIDIDSDGNILVCGYTSSSNFPITQGVLQTQRKGQDAFLVKMNSTGSGLIFGTYLGGSRTDKIYSVYIEEDDTILAVGVTDSGDFPVTVGAYDTSFSGSALVYDGFIARIDQNATRIIWSTYLGGTDLDYASKVLVDDSGKIYCTGRTDSTDFPTSTGAYDRQLGGETDGFIASLSSDGKRLISSTYLGGNGNDVSDHFVLDDENLPIISGATWSTDFPTTTGAIDRTLSGEIDSYIVKMDSSLGDISYGTFIGGSERDLALGIDKDKTGIVWVFGVTGSTDFPTTDDAFDDKMEKGDNFLVGFDIEANAITYSTYIGGNQSEWCFAGVYISGNWLAIVTMTASPDYPTTPGAYDLTFNGGYDLGVTRFWLDPLNGTEPSAPENLTVQAGDRKAELSWDIPLDDGGYRIRGYRVYSGLAEDALTLRTQVGGSETTCSLSPKVLGVPSYYAVSAINAVGEGNRSQTVNTTVYGRPSMPVDFTATPGCGTVHLTWSTPLDNGGLPLLGYRLSRGMSALHLEPLTNLTVEAEYLDKTVENGKTYHYHLLAFNSLGDGVGTGILIATPIGPPSEPLEISVRTGTLRVTIEWRSPESDGGRTITGYTVLRGTSEDTVTEIASVGSSVKSYIDTGLTNGETYFYAILAYNEIGNGPLSEIVEATPVGRPSMPLEFKADAGDGHVLLTWSPPEDDGGVDVIGYQVYRGVQETATEWLDGIIGDTTYNDTGLMNGQTLYYAVCAVNKVGDGPWTEVLPATPLALPDPPGDLVALAGNGLVTISWTRPMDDGGAEVTTYNTYRGTSEDDLEPLLSVTGSTHIHDDWNVEVGTKYYYAISAVNAAGEGALSIVASATPYGRPGIPSNLQAVPGNREVRLTWSTPDDDGTSPIEGYVILRGTSSASLREVAQLGDVTSYLDTGVTNGVTYLYAIAAINEAGPGDYTETIPAIPFKPATAPGKVTTLATDAKGAKVTLQWTAPQDDGGSPVTGYVILRGLTKGSLEQIAEVGPGVTTWSEDGLKRGTTYYYSVAAKNDVGEGEPILAREVKVPKKEAESPGFEVVAVMTAMLIVVLSVRRRWA